MSVLILRVQTADPRSGDHKEGVVLVERGIDPGKGQWALPGGFLDHAEDWRDAASRELDEELGLQLDPRLFSLDGDPEVTATNYYITWVRLNTPLQMDQLRFDWPDVAGDKIRNDKGQKEILTIRVATEPEVLAFDSHTQKLAEALGIKVRAGGGDNVL